MNFNASFLSRTVQGIASHPTKDIAEQPNRSAVYDLQIADTEALQSAVRDKAMVLLEQFEIDRFKDQVTSPVIGIR